MRPRVLDSFSPLVAARTFSFIFRRSRKLAFPRSMKDKRSNTKRLPIAARPRPRTSRFDAKAQPVTAHSRMKSGSGAFQKISNIGNVRRSGHRFRALLQNRTIDRKLDRA